MGRDLRLDTLTPPLQPARPPSAPRLPAGYRRPEFHMIVAETQGRPPTSSDVRIRLGFDGRNPAQALEQVLENAASPIHPHNQSFVTRTVQANHKAFTIAVNNAFV